MEEKLSQIFENTPFIFHIRKNDFCGTGCSILIMEQTGKSFMDVYWYDNDETSIYAEGLSVDENSQKQGLGNMLLSIFQQIGKEFGRTFANISVEENSWMHDWYRRNGFVDLNKHTEDDRFICMFKMLL